MILRPLFLVLLAAILLPIRAQAAGPAPFDLSGPALRVSVTRGAVTLPIAQVPNLASGDRVSVLADLPADQGTRYLLIAGFLRGATNPPPKSWFHRAQTWQRKRNGLTLVVPPGARQLLLFLLPETGGGYDAVVDTVRKQPGAFVRASQDLNQASLDRARLDTFLGQIQTLERTHPERIEAVSPLLTRSLGIRLDAECLQRASDAQAACLTQSRESLLLADSHSASVTDTLVGAPTDLALQLAATPQGGYGYYSPYIGAVRDLARIFGAFQSTQLQYIPALTRPQGDRIALLLNAAPSFGKPRSVIVAALPAIEVPHVPPLRRATEDRGFCATRRDLVLPVEGAALVYATAYAHDMVLRAARPGGGSVDLPVRADPAQGGFVLTGDPAALPGAADATLHGRWGFTPFDGPRFRLQAPVRDGVTLADPAGDTVIVGRDNIVLLQGPATRCIESIAMRTPAATTAIPLGWKEAGADRVAVTLPLAQTPPGRITLALRHHGLDRTDSITLTALAEAGRIDGFTLHAGDRSGTLAGTRLDMVTALAVEGLTFRPDGLTRTADGDRLALNLDPTAAADLAAGSARTARITLADGRTRTLAFTVAAARPAVDLIARTLDTPRDPARPAILLPGDTVLAQDGRLTFSLRARAPTRLTPRTIVEVATMDGQFTAQLAVGRGLVIQDDHVAVAQLDPAALGPSAHGPLRFRPSLDGTAGNWAPLVTLARRPLLTTLACTTPDQPCTLSGTNLFLIEAVARSADFQDATMVPEGFTAGSLPVPHPSGTPLQVRLRDAPAAPATLAVPAATR